MDGQYLPDDELDIDSLASSEPPEFVPQMFSEGGEVEDRDIEYYANGGEASVQSMNEYLLSDEEDAAPEMAQSASYGGESAPEMNLETARSMMRKLAAKGAGKSSRSKEMSMELSGLVPAIPDLGAPQTEQEKLTQIATARAQYDALEEAYKLKAQAAQRAGKGFTRATFSGSTFNQPTLEKAGPLMARTFAKGGVVKALKGTKAVDEAGKPVLAYRGEYGPSSGLSTQQGSLSYGTKEAANLYATRPNTGAAVQASKVFPSYLSIRKPLVNTPGDPFIDLSVLRNALGEKEFARVVKNNSEFIERTGAFERLSTERGYTSVADVMKKDPKALNSLYVDVYPILDDAQAVKTLQKRGYDGAIYGGSGATANEPEYRVFGASQAVSPYGMQPMAPRTAKQQFSDIVRGMDISPTDALELFGRAGSAAAMALTPSTLNEGEEEELARRRAMPPTITPPAKPYKEGGEADKKDQGPEMTGINRVTDFIAQRLPASSFPTSGRTLLETVQGKRDPITEGNFSPEELAVMKEMIALKGGDAGDIQYGDYQALAKVMRARGKIPASTTPSLFSMSDSLGNVQTTLGRFKYGRDDKGNLVVRDTYDFNPPQDPNSLQEQRTAEYGAMGPYSLIREYAGEKIPPGRGREININLGKPVKRAEGSPASGERLTPQQIERLAAEQAALNTYQPVMNRNIQRQGERSRNLASQRDVSTLPDPQTYAFIESALFGTPPDEVANKFGVFHPRRKDILNRAEQGFVTGNVAMVGPAAKMLKDVTAPAVKYLGKEAARQVERGIFNEGPLRAITPQPAFAVRPEGGGTTFTNVQSTGKKPSISKLDKMIDAGANPGIAGLSNEMGDAIENFWRTKAQNYYTRQYGTPNDPVFNQIVSGQLTTPALQKTIPDYAIEQTRVGKTRVDPVTGESRFYPKYPQALEDLTRTYDEMTGLRGVAFNDKEALFDPSYPSTMGDKGRQLQAQIEEGVTDKMIAGGLRPDLINPKVTLTGARGDGGSDLLNYIPSEYKELYSLYKQPAEEAGMLQRVYKELGLSETKVPGLLPENLKRAIETGEPIYDVDLPYKGALSELLSPPNINQYLATLSPKEISRMRFEDVVKNSARYNLDMFNTQNLVNAVRGGKRIPDKLWKQGLSEPLMSFQKEGAKEGEKFTWHRIMDNEATALEGAYLGHSVGGYAKGGAYGPKEYRRFKEGEKEVYTLRDPKGKPFTTVEVEKVYMGPLDRMLSETDIARAKAEGRELGPMKYVVRQIKGNGAKSGNVAPKDVDEEVLSFLRDYIKPDKITESENFLTPKLEQYKMDLSGRPRP